MNNFQKKLNFDFNISQLIIKLISYIDLSNDKWNITKLRENIYLKEFRKTTAIELIGSSSRIEDLQMTKDSHALHVNPQIHEKARPFIKTSFHYILILVFCFVILTNSFGANPNSEIKQTTQSSSDTIILTKQTLEKMVVQFDKTLIHERWFFYFNSLALIIIAGSTLLSALVIVKVQSFSNSLISIEKSIADAFSRRGKLNEYSERALKHCREERWSDYFITVNTLAKKFEKVFVPSSQKTSFIDTKEFVDSLIDQGKKFQQRKEKLLSWIKLLFLVTATVAGIAVLSLPAARWISENLLIRVWIGSGLVFFIIFLFFLRIIYLTFETW